MAQSESKGLNTLFANSFNNIRGDFFGGITAGVVALPLALAFGEQTEMGAIAGLYGAIAIGIVAAILGGTKTQISGPTAPMTVVSAVIITSAIDYMGSFEAAIPMIIATFFLAGAFQIVFGVVRLGNYIKYIPYPVISGFMSGIGVIIVITQIFPFFGIEAPDGGPIGTIRSIGEIPEAANIFSLLIASATIAIIYLFPKLSRKIPATLVALILLSLVAFFFLPGDTVLRINSKGPIPTGIPDIQTGFLSMFGNFKHVAMMLEYAITLAALGAIDSLLTSVVADNMTKTQHKSNRELIGQGAGNMVASIFGGLPGAGATMRTVINIDSGGRNRLSGVVAGAFLLAILLGLGRFVGHIPNAVLAGILITVGIGIIDYKGFRHIRSVPRTDVLVMLVVLFLTVFVDLLVAVGVGMVLAALLFMKRVSDVVEEQLVSAPLRDFSKETPWDDEAQVLAELDNHIYVKHFYGPLFFGFATRFKELVRALPEIQVVIMRMEKVPYVDQSGLYAMEHAIIELQKQNIKVIFTGLHGQPKDMFKSVAITGGLVKEEHIYETFEECAQWLYAEFDDWVKGDPES